MTKKKQATPFEPNEWYVNKAAHKNADTFFSGNKGGIPNNPENFRSFIPQDNFITRKNPYGDAEQQVEAEIPIFTKPNQRGSSFDPPPVPVEKAGRVKKDKTKAKGMSTSIGLTNMGPLRDVSPM